MLCNPRLLPLSTILSERAQRARGRAAASSVSRVFKFFRGPAKAREQLHASPEPFAARMIGFLETAFHEGGDSEPLNWAQAVRTRGAKPAQGAGAAAVAGPAADGADE